jgi:hypothetical protein
MKAFTDKQRQWLWFGALWCGGIVAAFLLAALARWIIAAS